MKILFLAVALSLTAVPVHAGLHISGSVPAKPAPASGNEGIGAAIVPAIDQAGLNRARAQARGNIYNPQIVCADGDVNIGQNSRQPVHVEHLTVLSSSLCPAHMRKPRGE